MNWLYVSGSNNGTKKIASLQVGVLIVDNIGRKDGTPSTILQWILQRLYKIPGPEPVGYNSLQTLKNISRKNGDPVNFTDFCIKIYLDNLYVKKRSVFVSS